MDIVFLIIGQFNIVFIFIADVILSVLPSVLVIIGIVIAVRIGIGIFKIIIFGERDMQKSVEDDYKDLLSLSDHYDEVEKGYIKMEDIEYYEKYGVERDDNQRKLRL